jgi:hypothetical protein
LVHRVVSKMLLSSALLELTRLLPLILSASSLAHYAADRVLGLLLVFLREDIVCSAEPMGSLIKLSWVRVV